MDQKTPEISSLDKISMSVMIHLHPNFLKSGFKIDRKIFNEKKLNAYNLHLTSVKHTLQKVNRYAIYFEKFYPQHTDEIRSVECLEHHIHAYLEDLDRLRCKIEAFLGELKNDIKKIATNKTEIDLALKLFINQIHKVFKNVSDNRNPHHHKGMKFLDGDLVHSDLIHVILTDGSPFINLLKPEALEELKVREEKGFEQAKLKWKERAEKNANELTKLVDEVFDKNTVFIYRVLNISPYENLIGL